MAADIIDAHNTFVQGFYSFVQTHQRAPLARLLPDELANIYPSEVIDSNCIVGNVRRYIVVAIVVVIMMIIVYTRHLDGTMSSCSLHGISDFLQLVRSRSLSSSGAPMPQQHISIFPNLLQFSEFQLSLLLEDVVTHFIAGKPLILTEPLRMPFKFSQPPSSTKENEIASVYVCECMSQHDVSRHYYCIYINCSTQLCMSMLITKCSVIGSVLDLSDITEKLPDTFKVGR